MNSLNNLVRCGSWGTLCLMAILGCSSELDPPANKPSPNSDSEQAARETTDSSTTASSVGFIKGFSWGFPGLSGTYATPAAADSMDRLVETNAEWICISFLVSMPSKETPELHWNDDLDFTMRDDELAHAIQMARERNLKVILKPMVQCRDGAWRATIKFLDEQGEDDSEAWRRWWLQYQQMLVHYGELAERTDCDIYCLGCEMNSAEWFESNWRESIAAVREVYSGKLMYNINHSREDEIEWWDALDIIGVSAYYPIGRKSASWFNYRSEYEFDSSLEGMKERLEEKKAELAALSEKHGKPILFSEIGVCSAHNTVDAPWTHERDTSQIYDGEEQARFYQANLEVFWDEPWFLGYTWWQWPSKLHERSAAAEDIGFCIYGKPAEELVKVWYSRDRTITRQQ